MKRANLIIIAIIFISSILFLAYRNYYKKPATQTPPLTKVKVAYIVNALSEVPVTVAIKNGYFEKYGLEVDVVKTTNATNNSKTFLSGGADIAMGYPTAYLLAAAEGANIKFIGVANYNNNFVFVSRKEAASINNIGITSKTGETYTATLGFLKSLGINSENVTFTVLGSQDLIGKALVAGSIDAAVYPESVWEMFKDRNKIQDPIKIIAKTETKDRKISGIFVKGESFESKKEIYSNFSKAILEADNFIKINSEDNVASVIVGVNNVKKEDAKYLARFSKQAIMGLSFAPDVDLIKKVAAGLEAQSPKMKDYKVTDFVSLGISDLLKKQGFIQKFGF